MIQYHPADGISDQLYMWIVNALECGPSLHHHSFSFERSTSRLFWKHQVPPLYDNQSGSPQLVHDGIQFGQLSVPQEHRDECQALFA
ncbi:MAG: hypothetical protein HEQ23_04400 [Tepidisphaera sp.]